MFDSLRPLSHDVVVADPPWPFDLYSEAGNKKSAAAHYDTMALAEIMALPVGHLCRADCLLLLWSCAPTLPAALRVMDAWGFTYKTNLVWRKVTKSGKVRMGPGYRARTMHETILLGVMGNLQHKPFPSIFDGVAREHSRKPDEFFDLIEDRVRPVNPLDLFSREDRPHWTTWGFEVGKFNKAAA